MYEPRASVELHEWKWRLIDGETAIRAEHYHAAPQPLSGGWSETDDLSVDHMGSTRDR